MDHPWQRHKVRVRPIQDIAERYGQVQDTGKNVAPWLIAGCDELGPDARGERQVTALQRVERNRQCILLRDMRQIRWGEEGGIEMVLQDGSRWVNAPLRWRNLSNALKRSRVCCPTCSERTM